MKSILLDIKTEFTYYYNKDNPNDNKHRLHFIDKDEYVLFIIKDIDMHRAVKFNINKMYYITTNEEKKEMYIRDILHQMYIKLYLQ